MIRINTELFLEFITNTYRWSAFNVFCVFTIGPWAFAERIAPGQKHESKPNRTNWLVGGWTITCESTVNNSQLWSYTRCAVHKHSVHCLRESQLFWNSLHCQKKRTAREWAYAPDLKCHRVSKALLLLYDCTIFTDICIALNKSSVLKSSITMSFHDIRYSNYFLAGFSSCCATVFTNPLEVRNWFDAFIYFFFFKFLLQASICFANKSVNTLINSGRCAKNRLWKFDCSCKVNWWN